MEAVLDSLSRKLLKELEEMQMHTGRMFRNMSIARMMSPESGIRYPLIDIYESADEFCVYADVAGTDGESLSVTAGESQVRIRGRKVLPARKSIDCVHQLEIEAGSFDRTVSLPGTVEIDEVTSSCKDGILTVVLPKKKRRGKVNITISTGDE
jgi:HSP20 family protein